MKHTKGKLNPLVVMENLYTLGGSIMKINKAIKLLVILVVILMIIVGGSSRVLAHCDGMDGPVVKAARRALETKNVNLILIWIQEENEYELKKAFENTLAVRKLNTEAKELADMYFFETLVRLHRAGEGAPYTGLKPTGQNLGPAIPAADKAIVNENTDSLIKLLTDNMQNGINEYFDQVIVKKNFNKDDVTAGREYVGAYVEFIHYVERLYESTEKIARGHYDDSDKGKGMNIEHLLTKTKEIKGDYTMVTRIPEPLVMEHEELHEELVKATKAGGKTGEAAKAVASLLHPHFVKEEEYALPPLGLLSFLAEGNDVQKDEVESVLQMTDRLKEELPLMLKEHKQIVAALEILNTAAEEENKPEYANFAQKLILHAQTEEEVLYPTSILIGEYIKLKLQK